jgi:hypothetical protein
VIISNTSGFEVPVEISNGTVTITDTDMIPPEITDVVLTYSTPKDTSIGWEHFTCTITDNIAVDEVKLLLAGESAIEYPMVKNGDEYSCNITITNADEYVFYIWADDMSNNNDTSGPWLCDLPLNEDVDESGTVHFMDLVAISLVYNDIGSDGWIREDVDNDGKVHFMDLVSISLVYNQSWKS